MIDNLNVKYNIPFLIPEQYNDAMSYQELLYAILDSVNKCIDMVNNLPEDVKEEVKNQLQIVLSDGTLQELITNTINTIVDGLNDKINDNKTAITKNSSDISELKTGLSNANTNIAENTSNIAENTSNIAENTSKISEIQSVQKATITALAGCTITSQSLTKINNICICSFIVKTETQVSMNTAFASIPNNFRPKSSIYFTMAKAASTDCINGVVAQDGLIKAPNSNLVASSYYSMLIVYSII